MGLVVSTTASLAKVRLLRTGEMRHNPQNTQLGWRKCLKYWGINAQIGSDKLKLGSDKLRFDFVNVELYNHWHDSSSTKIEVYSNGKTFRPSKMTFLTYKSLGIILNSMHSGH